MDRLGGPRARRDWFDRRRRELQGRPLPQVTVGTRLPRDHDRRPRESPSPGPGTTAARSPARVDLWDRHGDGPDGNSAVFHVLLTWRPENHRYSGFRTEPGRRCRCRTKTCAAGSLSVLWVLLPAGSPFLPGSRRVKRTSLALSALLLSAPVLAQTTGYGPLALTLSTSARMLALGDIGVAGRDDDVIFYNPAQLMSARGTSFSLAHLSRTTRGGTMSTVLRLG